MERENHSALSSRIRLVVFLTLCPNVKFLIYLCGVIKADVLYKIDVPDNFGVSVVHQMSEPGWNKDMMNSEAKLVLEFL